MKLSGIYFTVAVVFFILTLGALGLQEGHTWIAVILSIATASFFVAAVATRKSEKKKIENDNLKTGDNSSGE